MKENILSIIKMAIYRLYNEDYYLIKYNLCERCLAFKFGMYIQESINKNSLFNNYNFDSEYNKNINDVKRLPKNQNGTYPDFVIHQRGNNNQNLLVIECKKSKNHRTEKDIQKIQQFIDSHGIYNYKYGMLIIFYLNKAKIKIFEHNSIEELEVKIYNK